MIQKSLKMLKKPQESCIQSGGRREVVVDLPRSGRPSMSVNDKKINKSEKLVLENYRTSLKKLYQVGDNIFMLISYHF